MPIARHRRVDLNTTRYYHCYTRCVRRAFLCGDDSHTGRNFDHRKAWLVQRMKTLADVYAIRVCAYAVMSNHYHVTLYVDGEQARRWSEHDVIERWVQLFKHPLAVRYIAGETLIPQELEALSLLANEWRQRLMNLSWYMRSLNESMARYANAEDRCRGRFWEGRFESQALLDEGALLSCMVYVDLNPIRAGLAEMPEASDFTAIQARIEAYAANQNTPHLMDFQDQSDQDSDAAVALPFTLIDYFALVDWTGRAIREDKRGAIPAHVQSILTRLGLDETRWVDNMTHFGQRYYRAIGHSARIKQWAAKMGRRWMKGMTHAMSMYRYAV